MDNIFCYSSELFQIFFVILQQIIQASHTDGKDMPEKKNKYGYIKPHIMGVSRFSAIPSNLIGCLYLLFL